MCLYTNVKLPDPITDDLSDENGPEIIIYRLLIAE